MTFTLGHQTLLVTQRDMSTGSAVREETGHWSLTPVQCCQSGQEELYGGGVCKNGLGRDAGIVQTKGQHARNTAEELGVLGDQEAAG